MICYIFYELSFSSVQYFVLISCIDFSDLLLWYICLNIFIHPPSLLVLLCWWSDAKEASGAGKVYCHIYTFLVHAKNKQNKNKIFTYSDALSCLCPQFQLWMAAHSKYRQVFHKFNLWLNVLGQQNILGVFVYNAEWHPEQLKTCSSHNHSVEPTTLTVSGQSEESRAPGQNPRHRDLDLGFKHTTLPV